MLACFCGVSTSVPDLSTYLAIFYDCHFTPQESGRKVTLGGLWAKPNPYPKTSSLFLLPVNPAAKPIPGLLGRPTVAVVASCAMGFTLTFMKVTAVVHKADEGGFWAEVPSLPGCRTQGDTMDELKANLREAVELYLETDPSGLTADKNSQLLELAV